MSSEVRIVQSVVREIVTGRTELSYSNGITQTKFVRLLPETAVLVRICKSLSEQLSTRLEAEIGKHLLSFSAEVAADRDMNGIAGRANSLL